MTLFIAGDGVVAPRGVGTTNRKKDLLSQVLTGFDAGGQVRTLRQELGLNTIVAVVGSPTVPGEVAARVARSTAVLRAHIDEAKSDVVERVVILADGSEIIRAGLAPVDVDAAGEGGGRARYRERGRHGDGGLSHNGEISIKECLLVEVT